jgi:hypothetical protein
MCGGGAAAAAGVEARSSTAPTIIAVIAQAINVAAACFGAV